MFFKQTYNYVIDSEKEQITLGLRKSSIVTLVVMTVAPIVILPVIGFFMEKIDERQAQLELKADLAPPA